MKKSLSLLLAFVLVLALGTASGAASSSVIAGMDELIWIGQGVTTQELIQAYAEFHNESGLLGAFDLQGLNAYPDDELIAYLYKYMFIDETGNYFDAEWIDGYGWGYPVPGSDCLTLEQLRDGKVTVHCSVNAGSQAFDSVGFGTKQNPWWGDPVSTAHISVNFSDVFTSAQPFDFDYTVWLSINGMPKEFTAFTVAGTASVPVQSIRINSIATTTIRKNETLQLGVIYTPVDANSGTKVTWTTSNPEAVSIDENTGLITGIKAGGVSRITAVTENGKAYMITVVVTS